MGFPSLIRGFICLGSSLEIIITTSKNKLNQHKNKQAPPATQPLNQPINKPTMSIQEKITLKWG